MADSNGLTPTRASASTQAQNITHCSTMGSLILNKPGVGAGIPNAEFGQEVEINNLLILDQNTFEGWLKIFFNNM